MQTQPIQIPSPETCFELQKAGLLPPLNVPVRAYHLPPDYEHECTCTFLEDSVSFEGSSNWSKTSFIFAPTADQLLPIVKKESMDKDIAVGGLFWNEKYGYDFNLCPKVAPNHNLAQYLAEVLIYLLSKS
jgi:hypothetical protein